MKTKVLAVDSAGVFLGEVEKNDPRIQREVLLQPPTHDDWVMSDGQWVRAYAYDAEGALTTINLGVGWTLVAPPARSAVRWAGEEWVTPSAADPLDIGLSELRFYEDAALVLLAVASSVIASRPRGSAKVAAAFVDDALLKLISLSEAQVAGDDKIYEAIKKIRALRSAYEVGDTAGAFFAHREVMSLLSGMPDGFCPQGLNVPAEPLSAGLAIEKYLEAFNGRS